MLEAPVLSALQAQHRTKYFAVAAASLQGHRPHQEDALAVVSAAVGAQRPGAVACGVFDGHRGREAAAWAARTLPGVVSALPCPATPRQVANAFLAADADLLRSPAGAAGTTAVLAVLEPNMADQTATVTVAHVGDSRCLVWCGSDRSFTPLTADHKPGEPREAARIRRAGGAVVEGRVDGGLAVSRAFGNAEYKADPLLPPELQRVSAEPAVHTTVLKPGDFLVLASDGVFQPPLTNDGLMAFLGERVPPTTSPDAAGCPIALAAVLEEYLHQAVAHSKDNLTLLVVQPLAWDRSPAAAEELQRTHREVFQPRWVPPPKLRPSSPGYRQYVEAFLANLRLHGVAEELVVACAAACGAGQACPALPPAETRPEWKLPKAVKRRAIAPAAWLDAVYAAVEDGTLLSLGPPPAGTDVNAPDEAGHTALHYAVRHVLARPEDSAAVLALLGPGCRCDVPDASGFPALSLALPHPDLVAAVLAACPGGSCNARRGSTPVLVDAVALGLESTVSLLLGRPEIDVNATGPAGPALHAAVGHGRPALLEALLAHPQVDVNAAAPDGTTALHGAVAAAADGPGLAVLERLLASPGVDVNARDAAGRPPLWGVPAALQAASGADAVALLDRLRAAGADLAAVDAAGQEMLHGVCAAASTVACTQPGGWAYAALDWLTQPSMATCSPEALGPAACPPPLACTAADAAGRTPAHCLLAPDGTGFGDGVHVAFLRLLLERGADFSAKAQDGNTVWHTVPVSEHGTTPEEVDHLLEAAAGCVVARNQRQQTVLHTQRLALLPRLCRLGGQHVINAQDTAGNPPVLAALQRWLAEDPNCNQWQRVLKVLKRLPANLSRKVRNKQGQNIATLLQGTCEASRFTEWLDSGLGGPVTKRAKVE